MFRNEKDPMGSRMKLYESVETSRKLDPKFPIYARIDGRSFSKFTKKMQRPFDQRMSDAMVDTTAFLVQETHALLGYTQSDEISLVWQGSEDKYNSSILFDGKVQKLTSVLASMAAAYFATVYPKTTAEPQYPHFDCRVFQLPSKIEAANMFLWRQKDGIRNAVQSAAHHYFSSKALFKKSQKEMREMLIDKAMINFELQYPTFFKYGTWVYMTPVLVPADHVPLEFRPESGYVRRNMIKTECVPLDVYQIEHLIYGDD